MNQKFDPKTINPGGPQGMINIDPKVVKDGKDMLCINQLPALDERGQPIPDQFITCNGEIFVDAYRLKYISPILSPTGTNTVGNLMVGKICIVCGKLFNPQEWVEMNNKQKKGGDE